MLEDQPNRLQRLQLRKRGRDFRYIRFNSMGERIDSRGYDQVLGFGLQQQGVDDGNVGNQGTADDRHLHLAAHIGDDAELGQVGTAPGGGGNKDHGWQGPLDAIGAFIVVNTPAITGNQRNALGRIHGAAAAKGNHYICLFLLVDGNPPLDLKIPRVGNNIIEIDPAKLFFGKGFGEAIDPADLLQTRITHQKNLFCPQPPGASPRITQTPLTKNDLRD